MVFFLGFNYGMRGTVKGINFNCDSEILVFEEIREKSEKRNPKIWLHTKTLEEIVVAFSGQGQLRSNKLSILDGII